MFIVSCDNIEYGVFDTIEEAEFCAEQVSENMDGFITIQEE